MIQVGDKVRSFDFSDTHENTAGVDESYGRDLTGDRACYVEGEVLGFSEVEGCERYLIKVERDVFGGKDSDRRVGRHVHPPVNGTPKSLGGTTDFVELA